MASKTIDLPIGGSVDFSCDIFISYAHDDHSFAERLHTALKSVQPNNRIFFDQLSLRAGDNWEEQLQDSVERARHVIVIWSDHARDSDWVTRELYSFTLVAKPKSNPERRLVFLNLKGENVAMKAFQQVNSKDLQAAYSNNTDLEDTCWRKVAQEIEAGLGPKKRPLDVPLVLLSVRRDDLEHFSAQTWARIEADFSLKKDDVLPRYDDTRGAWRPYAGDVPVSSLLDQIRAQINAVLKDYLLVWKSPPENFWSSIPSARAFVKEEFETAFLSVLVVDPIALHHHDTYQRLMLFQAALSKEHFVILTLPPFGALAPIKRLRNFLMDKAAPYFDDYFVPSIPPDRLMRAKCGWNANDVDDVKRLILVALSDLSIETRSGSRSTYLRHGETR
jgi:hypothetical protein